MAQTQQWHVNNVISQLQVHHFQQTAHKILRRLFKTLFILFSVISFPICICVYAIISSSTQVTDSHALHISVFRVISLVFFFFFFFFFVFVVVVFLFCLSSLKRGEINVDDLLFSIRFIKRQNAVDFTSSKIKIRHLDNFNHHCVVSSCFFLNFIFCYCVKCLLLTL